MTIEFKPRWWTPQTKAGGYKRHVLLRVGDSVSLCGMVMTRSWRPSLRTEDFCTLCLGRLKRLSKLIPVAEKAISKKDLP